ncbi:MAG: hypothetical protein OXF79_22440 [Chloroflexi bacterium]|nr:hypothetical protein [Chloroflexota bacterium]
MFVGPETRALHTPEGSWERIDPEAFSVQGCGHMADPHLGAYRWMRQTRRRTRTLASVICAACMDLELQRQAVAARNLGD